MRATRLRPILSALLMLCSCTSLRLPAPKPVGGPAAEAMPDAPAVVLQDEATLSFRPQDAGHGKRRWVAVLDHRRLIKILRPEGLTEARVSIPIDGLRRVTRMVARAVSPRGAAQDADASDVRLTQRPDPRERAADVRCFALQVPGVQVGGAVEYRYEQVFDDPYDVPPWLFGGRLPVVRARFGIVSPDALQIDLLHGKGDAGFDRVALRRERYGNGQRLVFGEDDLPAYFPEPHGVHPAHRIPWLAVALRGSRAGKGLAKVEGWDDVAARVLDQMEAVGAEPAQGGVARALVGVRQALTPLALPGLGVRRPQAAAALAKGEPACSRDAAGFALGRVGGLSKNVRVVLATGPLSPPFAATFPARYPFGRALLALRMDEAWQNHLSCEGPAWRRDYLCGARLGELVLFAPDCPSCAVGVLPPELPGSRALAIDANGATKWVDIDGGEPFRHARNTEARLVMDVAGALSGTVDAELTGLAAARWRHALDTLTATDAAAPPAGAADAVAFHQIYGDGRAPRADGLVVRGLQDLDRGIFAHAQLSTSAQRTATDTYLLRPDALAGESVPGDWRAQRQESALLDGPSWHEALVLVTLPLGVEAEVQAPVKWVHPAAEYAAGFVQHGRTLKFSRRFVVKQAGIDVSDWADFAEFFAQIRQFERTALKLRPAS